jgi:glycerol kinase
LDQGTTGSTALVLEASGELLGRGYREFTQYYPRPGWVEHDPEEILRVTLEAAREALGQAPRPPSALGITNQRETVVVWDRASGQPLHRALVWQDRRTAERCRSLGGRFGTSYLADRTGLVWDPYFSATKIEWLLENVGGLRAKVENGDAIFGTIDSWLVYRLTSGAAFVTDYTNASRTMLFNIQRRVWDVDLLGLFGVPEHSLPAVRPSSGVVGLTDPKLFGSEVPIAGIAGDQQAALFGQGCWHPGQAKCTYGTGAFLLMNLGNGARLDGGGSLLTTIACGARGEPVLALEGSVFIAGAAVQWLRDGMGLLAHASETEAIARDLTDTGGVYFVPAFVGLGTPFWEADARGTIVGITRGTTRAHLIRAGLEAMAFSIRDVMDAMAVASKVSLAEVRADGGAAANDWLMQFQADALGVPVARPDLVETTALGAAGLAGLAVGVWRSAEEFVAGRKYTGFQPRPFDQQAYREWRRAVETTLFWARQGR